MKGELTQRERSHCTPASPPYVCPGLSVLSGGFIIVQVWQSQQIKRQLSLRRQLDTHGCEVEEWGLGRTWAGQEAVGEGTVGAAAFRVLCWERNRRGRGSRLGIG